MADSFTSFSCLFNGKTAVNVTRAKAILTEFERNLAQKEDGAALGFAMQPDEGAGSGVLCLHSEENGEPEHVIAFVKRCAEAFGLAGHWGFNGRLPAPARGRTGSGVPISSTLRPV